MGKSRTCIAYQNKDISSKALAEHFKGETFEGFGVRGLPVIENVMPTNLPDVEANELRLDNLFKLKDGSYAIVDYESGYDEANKLKYLNYIARVEKRLYNEFKRPVPLRVVIIYTADVKRGRTKRGFNAGCLRFKITEAFLTEVDSEEIYGRVLRKLSANEELSDKDLMGIIIYPLTFKGKKAKRKAITRAIDLIFLLPKDGQKYFVAKLVLAFTDKVITNKDALRIRRILKMTKVEQMIYDDYKEETKEEGRKEGRKEERKKANKEKYKAISNLLQNGVALDTITISYGLSESDVQRIKDKILQEA